MKVVLNGCCYRNEVRNWAAPWVAWVVLRSARKANSGWSHMRLLGEKWYGCAKPCCSFHSGWDSDLYLTSANSVLSFVLNLLMEMMQFHQERNKYRHKTQGGKSHIASDVWWQSLIWNLINSSSPQYLCHLIYLPLRTHPASHLAFCPALRLSLPVSDELKHYNTNLTLFDY